MHLQRKSRECHPDVSSAEPAALSTVRSVLPRIRGPHGALRYFGGAAVLTLLTVLTACSPAEGQAAVSPRPTEGGSTSRGALVPGIVSFYNDESAGVISGADTAQAGEDYTLTVTTFGGGCEEAGEASVVVTATGASVWVYDRTVATTPDVACTAILKRLPHEVTIRFAAPGEATIRIWGRKVAADTPPDGLPIVLEHRVGVQ